MISLAASFLTSPPQPATTPAPSHARTGSASSAPSNTWGAGGVAAPPPPPHHTLSTPPVPQLSSPSSRSGSVEATTMAARARAWPSSYASSSSYDERSSYDDRYGGGGGGGGGNGGGSGGSGDLSSYASSPPSPPPLASPPPLPLPPPPPPPWPPLGIRNFFCYPCTGFISSDALDFAEAITCGLFLVLGACLTLIRTRATDWLCSRLASSMRRSGRRVRPTRV